MSKYSSATTLHWAALSCYYKVILIRWFSLENAFITDMRTSRKHWEIIHGSRRQYSNSPDTEVSSHFGISIIFNDTYANWALLSKGHVFCPASWDNWPNTIYVEAETAMTVNWINNGVGQFSGKHITLDTEDEKFKYVKTSRSTCEIQQSLPFAEHSLSENNNSRICHVQLELWSPAHAS